MPNQSGSAYGLTLLCPIIDDDGAVPSHDLQIRYHLSNLPPDSNSPFAIAPGTHLARLVVLDDVIYVGMPTCEEHLRSKYLIFEGNCDRDIEAYFTGLAQAVPEELDAIWGHCQGYPGSANRDALLTYMKRCQIETTFFFAPVNDKTVAQTISALQTQRAVAAFVATHQGCGDVDLQRDFAVFIDRLRKAPPPRPAEYSFRRAIKTGGRNE